MSGDVDKESKTEDATEKKVADALEKGNVPFSREAGTFASLVGLLVVVSFFMVENAAPITATLRMLIDNPGAWQLENGADAGSLFSAIAYPTAQFLLPIVLVIAVFGLASSFLQNPPRLVADRIQPQLSRISLMKGATRIFGKQGWVEFAKSVFKLGAVAILTWLIVQSGQKDVLNSMFMEPSSIPEMIRGLSVQLLASVVAATAVLVAADLVWSRIFWQQELRMTRQEVKDERKQSDGDPIMKSRMRSLARDRQRKRMMSQVPRATLIITNPTHYAIALRYVRDEGGAPLVVAKGTDLIALKIREIATAHDIPIIEDKPLARLLYDKVQVDQLIPPEFYKAVAKIILYLFSRGTHKR